MPELSPASVVRYPPVGHIADKICATHARYGRGQVASSRVNDLYDLCVLRGAEAVAAVSAFLDPVLSGAVREGMWDPGRLAWP